MTAMAVAPEYIEDLTPQKEHDLVARTEGNDQGGLEALYCLWSEGATAIADLEQLIAQLPAHCHLLPASHRFQWLCLLRETFSSYAEQLSDRALSELAEVSVAWNDWHLLIHIADVLLAKDCRPVEQKERLATAYWHLGYPEGALDYVRGALLAAPRDKHLAQLLEDTQCWSEFCSHYEFYGTDAIEADAFYLEPLGHHHMSDFAWQYDMDIAHLCCLPEFDNADQWHEWLDHKYTLGDEAPFAVMHRQWGFIGMVSIIMHRKVGFVFYWLGKDFHGHGLAGDATRLLLELCQGHWDMHSCYAKVYHYNRPSVVVLEKLGFERLTVAAEPPHDEELFFRVGAKQTERQSQWELQQLFDDMGSSTRLQSALVLSPG